MIISNKGINLIEKIAVILAFIVPITVLIAPLPPFSPIVALFFFPYISAKTFFFRILIDVILVLVLALGFLDKKYRSAWSWITISGLVFTIIITIADFAGVNPTRSIFSNFERMEGLITLLHLAAYFFILISLFKTEKHWNKFFWINLGVAGVVAVYGLIQKIGWLAIQQGGGRIDGPFGNASYFATYMFFAFGVATFIFLGKKELHDSRPSSHYLIYGLTSGLFAFLVYLTGTRGALLGLIVTITLIIVGLLAINRGGGQAKKIRLILVSGLAVLFVAFLLLWSFKDSQFVLDRPTLARAASSFNLQDKTIESRLTIWRNIVWPGFKERPILGWGQENFISVFGKYYDPSMYNQEPWFDRTHNTILDWLIAGGLLGLLSYLYLLGAWVWCLIKVPGKYLSNNQKVILGAIIAGYIFQNLVIFDNLTSYLWFVTLLAYVHVLYVSDKNTQQLSPKNNSLGILGGVVSIFLVLVFMYTVNIKPLYANLSLIGAIQSVANQDFESGLTKFKKALAVATYGDVEIKENIVRAAGNVLADQKVEARLKQDYVNLLLEQYEQHFKKYPDDVRSRLVLASFLGQFGQSKQALELLDQAATLAPKKQVVFMMRARVQASIKNYPKALEDAKYAFQLDESYLEARMLYASMATLSGDTTLASELKKEISIDSLSINEQINYYAERNDYSKLVSLWQSKLESNPTDIQNYISLAVSLYANKQKDKALIVLEEALRLFPNLKDNINQAMNQIKSGTVIVQ
ncbi:MAG: O-antigen ligase family protein [Candidatus Vogelbacteria bacterium]|nr:O-antigen ligase family protein [Candidatus Vogelbacteria bacterium]